MADRPVSSAACSCDDEDEIYCDVHVGCDDNCKALREPPDDVTELRKTLDHWRRHGNQSGCSHAR